VLSEQLVDLLEVMLDRGHRRVAKLEHLSP
jgi:hypothetical protein